VIFCCAAKTGEFMAKKDFSKIKGVAQMLFVQGYSQKEIAEKLGVSAQSLVRWAKDGHWDTLKTSLLTSKNERIGELYKELAELNEIIKNREQGARFADKEEAKIRRGLIKDIEALETKYNIGQTSVIARDFVLYVKNNERETEDTMEFIKKVTDYFDMFIDYLIQKQKWQE
jgi:transcriptional regulator with XRE-family HTH domain